MTPSQPPIEVSWPTPFSVSNASSRKIISPANKLPNSRNDSEMGRAMNGTISSTRLAGISSTLTTGLLLLKGCIVNSLTNPPSPFILML